MIEIWKAIPSLNGWYEASNLGNIRSLYYNGGKRKKPRIRILRKRKDEYLDVHIFKKHYLVHLLVWEAFNGPIPKGMEVNHINEIRWDNRIDNLNLLTRKENINWGTGNEKRSKKIYEYNAEGILVKEWKSQIEAAKELNIAQGSISNNAHGKTRFCTDKNGIKHYFKLKDKHSTKYIR